MYEIWNGKELAQFREDTIPINTDYLNVIVH